MKNKFTAILLEILNELPNLTPAFLQRESLEYKMLRIGGFNPQKLRQGFYNLERRKIIKLVSRGYRFTSDGKLWIYKSKFRNLKISSKKWDKRWRIVIFDIPENFKKQRNILRDKLKMLDFFMLQESVFVCPFPCEQEVAFLAGYLKIGRYLDVLTANSVGFREEEIKKHYELN